MRTSYSALDTYKTCPLKYKFSQIDKIKGEKTKEQVFGTAVHKALQFMFKRNPLFPTLDEVLDFFASYWNAARDKLKIPDKEKDFYLEQGGILLKKFFLKNQPWNFNVLDLESRFEVLIDDPERGENHVLAGIIDRIDKPTDDSYEIIDYKTSRKMPSQEMVDKNLQLSIYNLGLTRRWPHLKSAEVKLSLYFLEHGEKISSTRPPEALEETKKEVLRTIREIQEREKTMNFPPMPGSWCAWCPYRPICPMWKHLYQKAETPSDEEIKAIVAEYFSIKDDIDDRNDRVKMLQQKIHQYLDEKGFERVFGAQGYITRKTMERPLYDKDLLKKAVKEKRKSVSLSISRKKLDKAEEEDED
ncbi:MAG: PD-(D/E)XK nuclease family protein [bacterium]|nr:PD-(D/E)XK nuclease family protein [bacterium]